MLLFTYSRSFYGHYYMQLAAPLCVLGGGLALWGDVIGEVRQPLGRWALRLAPLALAVPLLGLTALAGQGVVDPHQDRIFVLVSRYVSDAVPPGASVLATDEQFNFLAARPPSHTATGYLVDSYGHLIALGLGLNTRSWATCWGRRCGANTPTRPMRSCGARPRKPTCSTGRSRPPWWSSTTGANPA